MSAGGIARTYLPRRHCRLGSWRLRTTTRHQRLGQFGEAQGVAAPPGRDARAWLGRLAVHALVTTARTYTPDVAGAALGCVAPVAGVSVALWRRRRVRSLRLVSVPRSPRLG